MDPTLRKKMVVCTPFGEYVNGDQQGEMTPKRLKAIAANFRKHPRQVPVYALGDHVESTDDRMPDGWVEDLSVNGSGELVADVKLMGPAAAWVMQDQIRGASIGTVIGKNPDGSEQGEVLQHLLLTNNPFDKSLNIAATRKGGEAVASYFTALKESAMPDPKKTEPDQADKDRVDPTKDEPTVAAMKAKDDEIVALKGKILTLEEDNSELKERLDARPVDTEKEEQAVRLKAAEFKLDALEIRELVARGLNAGTLKPSWCSGYNEGGYNGTMSWFKASKFGGDKKLLAWAVDNNPTICKVGRTFKSGAPADVTGEPTIAADEQDALRKLGIKPEAVLVGMKAKDFSDYKALVGDKE